MLHNQVETNFNNNRKTAPVLILLYQASLTICINSKR